MYYLNYFLALGLLFVGCSKEQNSGSTPTDMQWNKIVIKGEFAVFAMYGNIDEYLLAGTDLNLLKTTDKGLIWKTVISRIDQIREFSLNGDTLIAIGLGKDFYSFDEGDTWQLLLPDRLPKTNQRPAEVKTSNNYIYKYIHNADGENGLPSDVLLSTDNGLSFKNVFPYQHYITSIYADNTDKVYLGIYGLVWKPDLPGFASANDPEDAIIYYTR